ncbi:MAG TPA: aldehyde dehydrogenase family protein, partial [Acidimicrobiales bacterium]|nr:aldehyde dehydrogenase family protein [Acidimicrobiales bacterium]
MDDAIGLVIDGAVVPGEAGTYPVTNPVRPAEVVLEAPSASTSQLDRAVAAARAALPSWAAMAPDERAELVGKASAAAGAAVETQDLATLLTREHGKVLWEAQFDSGTIGGMAGAFAPLAAAALATRSLTGGGRRTSVVHEPYGVVAAVLPFNWPVSVLGNKVLPALLAGNTIVVKAPPFCPGAVLAVTAALADALPPGVVNAVNGPAPELGEMLVSHPGVDMVSFTGGVPTGRAVMAAASGAVRPVVLELGGNDPAIVAPDVDIDDALVDKIVGASFITSGQVCMAIKRLYVPEDKVRTMVDALVARVGTEVVGDGLAPEVTMGPVHRPAARQRVEAMLEEAAERGARVHRPARVREEDAAAGGYLVSPAIVEGAPDDAQIVCEEQFAPALP